ncbi:hypothetical protein WN55_01431 [Dufourea novaeangliae]|uniref:Uncharacterized protein n=1 Tax=Dufourea novaeangliae TaxID=178035 RepID=A0A154PEN0_DUFNO|nr:hypothetical protein WN55_01431 [Dufourea novaeangliae]
MVVLGAFSSVSTVKFRLLELIGRQKYLDLISMIFGQCSMASLIDAFDIKRKSKKWGDDRIGSKDEFQIFSFVCLFALSSGAIKSSEPNLITKLTPANSATYEDSAKDLTSAASDRTFHISKEYGQPGYGGGVPYGTYYGSSYGPGAGYRGTGLNPGYLNTGYRGYPGSGLGGIIGGGHVGYGYYGGYNPSYGGYGSGGYGGYGGYGNGLGGYGTYGTGSYGSGYDDGYSNVGYGRGGYGRYGGYDGYGYGSGYGGYGGSNYGSTYNTRSNYDPYTNYHGTSYGSYSYPSGYRGYS